MIIRFVRLTKNALVPSFNHNDDAAFDIATNISGTLKPGEMKIFSTGIASEFPPGYFVSIRDRSGLAAKHGIHTLGGVIDSGYRGEWGIILVNLGKNSYKIEKGERIAQGVAHKLPKVKIVETKKINNSIRGKKGFGSSGK